MSDINAAYILNELKTEIISETDSDSDVSMILHASSGLIFDTPLTKKIFTFKNPTKTLAENKLDSSVERSKSSNKTIISVEEMDSYVNACFSTSPITRSLPVL